MEKETEYKSKSQMKREMLALQSLGERLVGLAEEQLKRIEMPQELREAVLFAKTIKKGEALRRQIQYIGALMREADPAPIQEALDSISRGRDQDVEQFKKIEIWRDGLIAGDDGLLDEIASEYPGTDRRKLIQLAEAARREQKEKKTPKSSRALFRLLRSLLEA